MTRFRLLRFWVGLVTVFLLSAQFTEAQTKLKWAGKAGDKFRYTFTQKNEHKYSLQGTEHRTKSELNVDMSWTIRAIATDGVVDIAMVPTRVRSTMTLSGQIFQFDSNEKAAAIPPEMVTLAKIYNAMIDQTYLLKMSPSGEVLDARIPDLLAAAVGGTAFAASADSGGLHSPKGLKNMFAQFIPKLPPGEIAPKAAWKSQLVLPSGEIKMTLINSYQITEIAPIAKFAGSCELAITTDPNSSLKAKLGKQLSTSKFQFDTVNGRLEESQIDQAYDWTLTANGTEIPQSFVINSSFKIVK